MSYEYFGHYGLGRSPIKKMRSAKARRRRRRSRRRAHPLSKARGKSSFSPRRNLPPRPIAPIGPRRVSPELSPIPVASYTGTTAVEVTPSTVLPTSVAINTAQTPLIANQPIVMARPYPLVRPPMPIRGSAPIRPAQSLAPISIKPLITPQQARLGKIAAALGAGLLLF